MNARMLTSCGLALALSIVAVLLVQACGGSNDVRAQAASSVDPVVGVFESTITIRDCSSGAVLRSFKGVDTFHQGGTLSDSSNAAPATRGPGAGVWRAGAAEGAYTANFRFYRYNADGTLAGTQKVNRTFTLAADGSSTTGTIAAQILDTTDAVLQTLCGTEASVRLF